MSLCWHIVNLTPFTYRFGAARYVCCGTLYANSSGVDKTIRLPGSYVRPPPSPSVKRTATQTGRVDNRFCPLYVETWTV